MLQSKGSKGLGIAGSKGGVVCLLQHYCPFCFKGRPGVSCGIKVKKGSPLIDEVQAMHAANRNGLTPLDFRHPGDFCSNPALCKMVCLVCGQTMIDGEDPEFELFLNVFGGYSSDEEIDVATNYEVKDRMSALGLVWTKQWDTPIHKACSKKAVCKCVVALGTTTCPVHQFPLEQNRRSLAVTAETQPAKPKPPKQLPVPVVATTGVAPSTKVAPAMSRGGTRLMKADWLPPPKMAANTVQFQASPTGNGKGAAMDVKCKQVGGVIQKQPIKTIKTVRLEQAAATCAYKIDAWTAVHPTNKKLDNPLAATVPGKGSSFSLEDHYRLFDPDQHGWRKINGVKGFMHYNGVFIPTDQDVIVIHNDGSITPG